MSEDLHQLLREHGLQVTAQRLAIMGAVASRPHATADELIDEVRSVIGSISRQAVYDTLGILADKHLVRRIQPAGSAARYEDRVGDNHHHLICRGCGVTFDIDCAVGEAPCLDAGHDHGFVIDEAEVIYWGRCPTCRQAADAGAPPE
jgi:Fur family ferric uptake transcriptional regulator